jgi:outer membrane protein TolC
VSFAERQVDVARERFTRGLSNNLDLVSAETELAEAENLRFTTAASLAVVRLQIRAATGALDEPANFWRP